MMKTIIVYSSQTGFTKRYADWLAEELGAEAIALEEAKKQSSQYFEDADAIVYGGWAMGGRIVNSEWFTQRIPAWKGKKLVLYCVGASPNELPEVRTALDDALTDEEKKYAKAFYCQGGIDYEKMKLPSRLAMKAFASMVRKKKDASEQDRIMGEMISHSYDISDRRFIMPIVDYLRGNHSFAIRNVMHKDYEEVIAIMNQVQQMHVEWRPDIYRHNDNLIPEDVFEKIVEGDTFFVAETEGKVVGVMEIMFRHTENPSHVTRNVIFIDTMAVDEKYRGMGIGHLFFEKAKEIKEQKNYDGIELQVNARNRAAYEMYSKYGFKEKSINMELL